MDHAVLINHGIAVRGQRAAQGDVRIEHAALVKVHHAQKVSAADLSARRLHFTAQQAQQRGFPETPGALPAPAEILLSFPETRCSSPARAKALQDRRGSAPRFPWPRSPESSDHGSPPRTQKTPSVEALPATQCLQGPGGS